ncbi:MAG: DUF4344 domain-containing metallopeptidase [Pyrinomonadaceae bacterium]
MRALFKFCSFLFLVSTGLIFVSAQEAMGQVSLEISPNYSAIAYHNNVVVPANEEEVFELSHPPLNDGYTIHYKAPRNVFTLVIIDGRDVQTRNPKPVFLRNQRLTDGSAFPLPNSPHKAGIVVAFSNDTRAKANLSYVVFRTGLRSQEVVGQMRRVLEIPIVALDKFYRLPKFKVAVVPCGAVNAYSDPDISICSELIADLYEKNLDRALYPILFHEMAHSLLNLWNLPGYDNEDVADEFAAVMLAQVSPQYIDAFIKYLEQADSTTEAIVQLTKGSRHTVSIQRARNMKSAMGRMSELERRWNNLLKPYQK